MKILSLLVLGVLLVSLTGVAAQYANVEVGVEAKAGSSSAEAEAGAKADSNNSGIGAALSAQVKAKLEVLKGGNYSGPLGVALNIKVLSAELRELREDGATVKTRLNLSLETDADGNVKLKANLSNGRNAEVKVMPSAASETALARLRLKVCSPENNCTIELKEVGAEANAKAAYEVKVDQKVKVLGLFPANAHSEAQIDAETGAVLRARNPWWAFMATSA